VAKTRDDLNNLLASPRSPRCSIGESVVREKSCCTPPKGKPANIDHLDRPLEWTKERMFFVTILPSMKSSRGMRTAE